MASIVRIEVVVAVDRPRRKGEWDPRLRGLTRDICHDQFRRSAGDRVVCHIVDHSSRYGGMISIDDVLDSGSGRRVVQDGDRPGRIACSRPDAGPEWIRRVRVCKVRLERAVCSILYKDGEILADNAVAVLVDHRRGHYRRTDHGHVAAQGRQYHGCKLVMIGRRGISRTKRFLFGSVSNKIVQQARDMAVWVVC